MRLPTIFKGTKSRLQETDRTAILAGILALILWLAHETRAGIDKDNELKSASTAMQVTSIGR
jgi:hypothetical protein